MTMTRYYTPDQQYDPTYEPRVGDIQILPPCLCWRIGTGGKTHLVYQYNRDCGVHGKHGYQKGKKFINREDR